MELSLDIILHTCNYEDEHSSTLFIPNELFHITDISTLQAVSKNKDKIIKNKLKQKDNDKRDLEINDKVSIKENIVKNMKTERYYSPKGKPIGKAKLYCICGVVLGIFNDGYAAIKIAFNASKIAEGVKGIIIISMESFRWITNEEYEFLLSSKLHYNRN